MGCCSNLKVRPGLIQRQVRAVFEMLDYDKRGCIDREKVAGFWKGPYAETYTKVLFQEIDLNKDGVITRDEWAAYWKLLHRVGFSKQQILASLQSFKTGNLDMAFRYSNYRRSRNRNSLINEIIQETSVTASTTTSNISSKISSAS